VTEIEIDLRGYVNARQKDKLPSWCRVPASSIPNFSVFNALIRKGARVVHYQR
jgi:hypothetical protein